MLDIYKFSITAKLIEMHFEFFFPDFYNENKRMLIFASIGLTLPIILRGVIDLVSSRDEDFDALLEEYKATYDTILFLVCDLVPIGFQFSSLIFGFIRRKRNRR